MTTAAAPSIRVEGLRKTYDVPERDAGVRAAASSVVRRRTRSVDAVAGIEFEVRAGEVVGVRSRPVARRHLSAMAPGRPHGPGPGRVRGDGAGGDAHRRLDAGTFLVTLLITPAALLGSRWLWRYGLRHYTGASA